ncbi:FAD dependent oxidoreductase [Thelonectria olida]|uniref:FAD dependent oxidoreductase n=1 Tax=Thelonectria olida TaxID=1576542 RepID=A0A9P8WMB5_9HYPO|nr:FAD dependent oxidoreductase [Thelonectria olida]
MSETVLIVGAGIVGSSLAHFLSKSPISRNITVVDRSVSPLLGSTGHAPGFVGQFNESEVLTRLAIETVDEYTKIPGGFETVGGLEVASTPAGIAKLQSRYSNAAKLGLPSELVPLQKAQELAPNLVDASASGEALHFLTDGTANAGAITSYFRDTSTKAGVQFLERDVKGLVISDGRITGVEVQEGESISQLTADKVVLATGIWAQHLCKHLEVPIPVVPVGHPYMYGETRAPIGRKLPFVRWPESHAYARDHGDHYGIGTYNHQPLQYRPTNGTAIGDWISDFEDPLKSATALLPDATKTEFAGGKSFNGIFSMTPDNMPLAGAVQSVRGLYLAVAVWVTHAAGTAKFIAKLMDEGEVDTKTREALDPDRFKGQDSAKLETKSLNGYNEIYKTVEGSSN